MACNTLEGTHTTTVQWTPRFLVPFYVEGILRCFFLETVVLNLTLQFSQSVENNDVRDSGDTDAQNDAKDLKQAEECRAEEDRKRMESTEEPTSD